jgi:hypothetical protein
MCQVTSIAAVGDHAPRYIIHDRDDAFARRHHGSDGNSGGADGARRAMAERVRRTILGISATRVPRSHGHLECRRPAPGVGRLRPLLDSIAHPPRAREGCTDAAADCPARCRTHRRDSPGLRPPPSLRASRGVTHASSSRNDAAGRTPTCVSRRLGLTDDCLSLDRAAPAARSNGPVTRRMEFSPMTMWNAVAG